MKTFILAGEWQVKQIVSGQVPLIEAHTTDGWFSATVPGTVHQDLIAADQIPDPFFSLNENDVQWVGEADWLYRITFAVPVELLNHDQLDLVFDGLDTFASVWLNGELLLTSDNMFVPQRRPVEGLLKATDNVLLARFESAFRHGKALEAHYGSRAAWNGDASRVYVRKAQYHYGWDWGPVLITAGFWRAVRLEAYHTRIVDVSAPVNISADLGEATIPVQIELSAVPPDALVTIRLTDVHDTIVSEKTLPITAATITHRLTVSDPALWYPRGFGQQPRYKLTVTLHAAEKLLDSKTLLLGLRRLRLIQETLSNAPGTSFYFEVNNIPLFCGGANWIPADSFTPRVTAEHYRRWLQLAADGNMTMLRVWGGGIYEEDVFYDLCDEMGLLVWQDFMFACGIYPAHPEFLANVRVEAETNVRRLRHHPSLAIWCGNNEDYQIAESINAYDSEFNGDFTQTAFPAREIYERLLPEVCGALDPGRPYWPGSAYGGRSASDQTVGDRHTWDVWHGKMADYRDYPLYTGRFVSEFGMQAAPIRQTIDAFTRPDERALSSPVLRHHNKATDGMERLAHYLEANIPGPSTLDDYIYGTQFIQSEALAAGVEGWRRLWAGPGCYANGGALIWQLNDCWPVISWAIADYDLQPKLAYYRIRRALAPIALGLAAKSANASDGVVVWAVNATPKVMAARLDLQAFGLDGTDRGKLLKHFTLAPFQSTELGAFFAEVPADSVVSARLIKADSVIARAARWPEPAKRYDYPNPGLTASFAGRTITLSVQRPARSVMLTMTQSATWSDNMLDLMPGDDQVITVARGERSTFTAHWYNASRTT